MRAFTKILTVCAGVLFVAALLLAFLGADSVERPATQPLMSASGFCMAASIIVFLIRLLCGASLRRHTDV
jgi:hypothetical protein